MNLTFAAGSQVLHYGEGQRYEQHHDFLIDSVNPAPENGGQRMMTFLMYLTTVEEGGETLFPLVCWSLSTLIRSVTLTEILS